MTTEALPHIAASRFERILNLVVAAFALTFSIQTVNSLQATLPTVGGVAGRLFIGLIVASLATGVLAGLVPRGSVVLFRLAFALFAAGLACWPFAIVAPVTPSPLAWPVAVWPVQAVFLAAGHRRAVTSVLIALASAVPITLVLLRVGAMEASNVAVHGVYVLGSTVVFAGLLGAFRHATELADRAQDLAVAKHVNARRDDAEEIERARTDALVHDCVLTTLLSAGSAVTEDEEDLSRRMASNALRVLGHVNRSVEQGPAVPFGQALARLGPELGADLARFDVRTGGADHLMLPAHVADALLQSMVQLIRDTVDRGTPQSIRARTLGPDGIRITVRDGGADPGARVRDTIAQQMRAIDGRAEVTVSPTGGTAVTLSWGSVVITGTAPQATGEMLVRA